MISRWFLLLWLFVGYASANPLSVAVFYGANPPIDELQAFDVAVVEPEHVSDSQLNAQRQTQLFAYVSVGEVAPHRSYFQKIPTSWRLGSNANWGSVVIDQSQSEWPAFYAEQVIKPLWDKGYRGFFLDTLDSYQLFAKSDEQRASQEAGMIAVVRELRQRFPNIKLIFNRGFEILPKVHGEVFAVAIESLFQSWNAARQSYQEVNESDRSWLLDRIKTIQTDYQLPVLIIDYVAPHDRELARQTANKIRQLNLTPWVTDGALSMLGIGEVEVLPRKVLMIYNGANNEFELFETYAARFGTLPLNYLGYSVEYLDARKALPSELLTGRYAGVVVWLDKSPEKEGAALVSWLQQQTVTGVPVLVLGEMNFLLSENPANFFGLTPLSDNKRTQKLSIKYRSDLATFEASPLLDRTAFYPLHAKNSQVLLSIENERQELQEAVAITPWGGYAASPQPMMFLPQIQSGGNLEAQSRWVVNPIELFRQALRLPDMPVPDLSTESGRRMLMAHVDGDGFSSRAELPGQPYASQVMLDRILKKYPLPITVSIVQAEISKEGLSPLDSHSLEHIAKAMFALPHVEIASHSYSHPFFWQQNAPRKKSFDHSNVKIDDSEGWYRLMIPGYDFDINNEIVGSLTYIRNELAPKNKQVNTFLWTGNCNPGIDALEIVSKNGILAMNGGDTLITKSAPSISLVAPIGVQKGALFQVYAPNQNENVYTNDWAGPYNGYERVIETFTLTDTPYRLKPMDIYFHIYSASKVASLNALEKVIGWSLQQEVTPVLVTEYIEKVRDFNHMVVARSAEGWQIKGANKLRQLRMPLSLGMPELSQGIAGFNQYNNSRYVHLAQADATIRLARAASAVPYLVSANAKITSITRTDKRMQLGLQGHVPIQFELSMPSGCEVSAEGVPLRSSSYQGKVGRFAVSADVIKKLRVDCK